MNQDMDNGIQAIGDMVTEYIQAAKKKGLGCWISFDTRGSKEIDTLVYIVTYDGPSTDRTWERSKIFNYHNDFDVMSAAIFQFMANLPDARQRKVEAALQKLHGALESIPEYDDDPEIQAIFTRIRSRLLDDSERLAKAALPKPGSYDVIEVVEVYDEKGDPIF